MRGATWPVASADWLRCALSGGNGEGADYYTNICQDIFPMWDMPRAASADVVKRVAGGRNAREVGVNYFSPLFCILSLNWLVP